MLLPSPAAALLPQTTSDHDASCISFTNSLFFICFDLCNLRSSAAGFLRCSHFLDHVHGIRLVRHCVVHKLFRRIQRIQSGQGHHSCHLVQTLNHFHDQKLFHLYHLYTAFASCEEGGREGPPSSPFFTVLISCPRRRRIQRRSRLHLSSFPVARRHHQLRPPADHPHPERPPAVGRIYTSPRQVCARPA